MRWSGATSERLPGTSVQTQCRPASMDPSSDQGQRQIEPAKPAGSYDAWVVAFAACLGIILVVQGGFGLSFAIGVIVILLAMAWYLSRRAGIGREGSARVAPSANRPDDHAIADIVASLPDPTMLLDAEGRVVTLNSAAVSIAPALKRGEP